MRDVTEAQRSASCSCTGGECDGNCRQLVELLSLFKNSVKSHFSDNDDADSEDQLREEIRQVLERQIKKKTDKMSGGESKEVVELAEDEREDESKAPETE